MDFPYLVIERILDMMTLSEVRRVGYLLDPYRYYQDRFERRIQRDQIDYLERFPYLSWHLSCNVTETVLLRYSDLFWDWHVLSKRMSLEFIQAHSNFPWYLDVLSNREPMEDASKARITAFGGPRQPLLLQ